MPHTVDDFGLARGFCAAATACGLKASGAPDLALVVADAPCSAAGTFTTNRVKAAPVLHDQEVLERNPGGIRAVVANAGCANACTGERGMADARAMAALTAQALGCAADQVLVLSTGVIGVPLDMEKIARGIAAAGASVAPEGAPLAARAIMTTDTRPKVAGVEVWLGGGEVRIRGFAKGAGMIHPDMATMLAVVTTDAAVAPLLLQWALREAVGRSFNRVSVDGDMSTNDTVLLLASGAAGARVGDADLPAFTAALTEACTSLAKQIARDGEGATRLVEITVTGARDKREAHQVADSIARSPLVKSAVHGGDPNWGRVLAAAGCGGAELDPGKLALWFGAPGQAVQVVAEGRRAAYEEQAAAALLRRDPVAVLLDLGLGSAEATVWTCDLSAEYVAINAHYTT
ncbi:MAG: bifunctional glutamate N-acetyltransferase/amino-acid acetyltransferase ArgJ [Candidatus Eisenbacteria bacterium]|nr:bifunctional glutamate N-acetyltransferase/amino-acid acetyltransferase ArgJ [Candidatus Eisenbacteria bacterium]